MPSPELGMNPGLLQHVLESGPYTLNPGYHNTKRDSPKSSEVEKSFVVSLFGYLSIGEIEELPFSSGSEKLHDWNGLLNEVHEQQSSVAQKQSAEVICFLKCFVTVLA